MEAAASPWDSIGPSPTPIRASGSSVRSATSRYGGKSNQVNFSSDKLQFSEVLRFSLLLFLFMFTVLCNVCSNLLLYIVYIPVFSGSRMEKMARKTYLKTRIMRYQKACV